MASPRLSATLLALSALALVAAGCSSTPATTAASAKPSTAASPAAEESASPSDAPYDDAWLDPNVPRAELDEQGEMNRIGLALGSLSTLGVPDAALTPEESAIALRAICDSLDRGNSNATAIFDMASAIPNAEDYGAEVLAAAAYSLCPEHQEAVAAG